MTKQSKHPSNPSWIYLSVALAGILAVSLFSNMVTESKWPYTSDSAQYIQAADSFASGNGFRVGPRALSEYDEYTVPLTTFPIGYPLLAGVVTSMGLDVNDAAQWTARVSWMLLPLAILFALRAVIGTPMALGIAVLAFISPGALNHGFKAISDMPYLLLTVLSIGLLIHSFTNASNKAGASALAMLFTSGLLAGLAYLVRNVGMALILATLTAFLAIWIVRLIPFTEAAKRLFSWLAGLSVAIAPLAINNLIEYGAVNPYFESRPPPQFGFLDNTLDFISSLIFDLTDLWGLAALIRHPVIAFTIVAVLGIALLYGIARHWKQWSIATRFSALLFLFYFGAGAAAVIIAASIFLVEQIGPRLVMQYSWVLLALIVLALGGRNSLNTWYKRLGIGGFVLLTLATHAWHIMGYLDQAPQAKQLQANNAEILDPIRNLPEDAVIFSNDGPFLSIETGRVVGQNQFSDLDELRPSLTQLKDKAKASTSGRPAYFVLLPFGLTTDGKPVDDIESLDIKSDFHPDFSIIARTRYSIIFKNR